MCEKVIGHGLSFMDSNLDDSTKLDCLDCTAWDCTEFLGSLTVFRQDVSPNRVTASL